MSAAFFQVHRGLDREGPGTPEDVFWALRQIRKPPDRVLDAACGPGADTETLASALPDARIDAIDKVEHFVEAAAARARRFGPRVQVSVGDMAHIKGPYDLIWCAGAVYFMGMKSALETWRGALAPDGSIVFSEPLLPEAAGDAAMDFWQEYPQITDAAGIDRQVRAAGFHTIATRLVRGDGWAAYYTPMAARIAQLRSENPSPEVAEACDEAEAEIEAWRRAPEEIAYLLSVVRP